MSKDDPDQALQRLEDAAGRDADEEVDSVTTQTLQRLDVEIETTMGDKTALEIEQENEAQASTSEKEKTKSG